MARKQSIRGEGRDRLIRAAAECFTRGGGAAMSVKDVCAQADASVGTVYHHFPMGLPDLEAALYLETLAGYQGAFLEELRTHRSARSGIEAIVRFHLGWMADNVQRAHYLLYFNAAWLSGKHSAVLTQMNEQFAKTAAEWRDPFVATGEIRRLPSILYGPVILGPAQQYGSAVISSLDSAEAPNALRRAIPVLAESAWIAVRGEPG